MIRTSLNTYERGSRGRIVHNIIEYIGRTRTPRTFPRRTNSTTRPLYSLDTRRSDRTRYAGWTLWSGYTGRTLIPYRTLRTLNAGRSQWALWSGYTDRTLWTLYTRRSRWTLWSGYTDNALRTLRSYDTRCTRWSGRIIECSKQFGRCRCEKSAFGQSERETEPLSCLFDRPRVSDLFHDSWTESRVIGVLRHYLRSLSCTICVNRSTNRCNDGEGCFIGSRHASHLWSV